MTLRFVHITRFINTVRKSLLKEEPLPDQSTELTTNLAVLGYLKALLRLGSIKLEVRFADEDNR